MRERTIVKSKTNVYCANQVFSLVANTAKLWSVAQSEFDVRDRVASGVRALRLRAHLIGGRGVQLLAREVGNQSAID